MRFFSSKFFLFGVFALLLLSIPLTIFFIKRQQDLRTKAAPSTTLSFSPATRSVNVETNFDLDVMINPGQNIVSFVKLQILFDATKIEAVRVSPNTAAFPLTLDGPVIAPGSLTVSLGIGSDPTKAVQSSVKVADITFKSLAATTTDGVRISFEPTQTQVLSLSSEDQPGENVLLSTSPATIIITSDGTAISPSPTPSPTPSSTVSPTSGVDPTGTTPTPTGGLGAPGNVAPVCTSLAASVTKGSAPLLVNFTAKGSDQDGTITKATFNFGDTKLQDVTQGGGAKTVEMKASHTYQAAGKYTASVTFTDNSSGVSSACTQLVEATTGTTTGSTGSGTVTSTATSSGSSPTLAAPGNINITLGLVIGISIFITTGVFLLLL